MPMVVLAALAQRNVTGTVVENETGDALPQTTVRLLRTDSTLVKGALTKLDGKFSMNAPSAGKYILQVTCVGYKSYTKNISISGDKDVALGTITMKPDAIMLKGATVTGQAAKVTLKADTFVYNASAYRTPEGSVVEELVKRLPGAQIDDAGKITINGKEVKKIMVDGKEFMTGDTKTAMKNLPTSIVERVRAYDQKSDLARVSGIDDGEEETVLDFGIKQGMNKGMMVNADLAAGTKHRYSGRIFGGYMKDDLKLFLMSSANNVNDMGFSTGGGRFGGGRQGLTATKMTGVNLNYEKKNKLKLDGSIRWNHSDGDATIRRSTEDFMTSTASTFSNSHTSNMTRNNSWDARLRLEWTPDSMTNIMFRPNFQYNSSDGLNEGISATFSTDPYDIPNITNPLAQLDQLIDQKAVKNSNMNNAISYSDNKSLGGNLQLNRKLGGGGRNITLRLGGNYGEGTSKSFSNDSVNYYQFAHDSVYQANRYAVTPTKNWNYSVRATYSEPIMHRTYLQFSYQYQYRYTKSDRGTYDFSKLGPCSYPGYTGTVFEPNDEYKGDFARTYFYMVTCYEEKLADWYQKYADSQPTLDGNAYPGLSAWQLEMLMKWAENDPVSEKETNRNNAVFNIQKNRNPFIDYPGLEAYIWGDKKDVAFSYSDYATEIKGIIERNSEADDVQPEAIYSPDGKRLTKPHNGLNIMRLKNGKRMKTVKGFANF